MPRRDWTRDELILAMNLYCQLPFGRMHKGNPEVIALANAIGRTPSSVAMRLVNLASLDPVHQERGVKGLSGVSEGARAIWHEFHGDWERLSVESEALKESRHIPTVDATVESMIDSDSYAGETEGVADVRIRLAQRFFRRSVLASYESRCCVTGISIPQLLIASHILPWSSFPEHRIDPRNGLCLSRIHDAAFDQGLITFDEDFRLVLSTEILHLASNTVMRAAFHAFEGIVLRLPSKFRPPPDFLLKHRTDIFKR